MATPTAIVAYLALFAGVAALFLFVNLLVGRLVRPKNPNAEKLEVYECGEPAIGSSFVQFDLRFYVVALLFIIFDVEVAFFFPWATVYGKAVQLTSPSMNVVEITEDGSAAPTPEVLARFRELGVRNPQPGGAAKPSATAIEASVRETARTLALTSFADIGVFFGVLMVGFAYVWRRGDLNWVRAVSGQQGEVMERSPPRKTQPVGSAAGSILST